MLGSFRHDLAGVVFFVDMKNIGLLLKDTSSSQNTRVDTVEVVGFRGAQLLEFFLVLLILLDPFSSLMIRETRTIPGVPDEIMMAFSLLLGSLFDFAKRRRHGLVAGT